MGFDAGGCEDLGHWAIYPDSTFVKWDSAVISSTFRQAERRPSEVTHQRFRKASQTEYRCNLFVCRSLLFASCTSARPSLAFLSRTAFVT